MPVTLVITLIGAAVSFGVMWQIARGTQEQLSEFKQDTKERFAELNRKIDELRSRDRAEGPPQPSQEVIAATETEKTDIVPSQETEAVTGLYMANGDIDLLVPPIISVLTAKMLH